MSEEMLGYLEAAFLVCGLLAMIVLLMRLFDPARRTELEEHGRLPFRDGEGEGKEAGHGQG